ncbi:NAAT family transporter [Methyloligella sp. 2.7D]|uniref:MarC family protein n=1 Tax=unclassified Methyloligella TaxID=2625955 RepID=UPI00157BCD91|nr:NAAT family transporter [Methyloligella sp. GL2]QKP78392.1 NAAT family transporter [Methyloligella sp. GL2]
MLDTFLTAFTAFFAVVNPINTAVLLASLTPNFTDAERRWISVRAVSIASIILLGFVLIGHPVLTELGVSLAALKVAGGIILMIIALRMTLGTSTAHTLSSSEHEEAAAKTDARTEIAVFPLATPLIAGPGAMTSAIVLSAGGHGVSNQFAVVVALLAVMAATLALLLIAQTIQELLGVTARKVVVRVLGILLAALAMQSIFNGIADSHLLG